MTHDPLPSSEVRVTISTRPQMTIDNMPSPQDPTYLHPFLGTRPHDLTFHRRYSMHAGDCDSSTISIQTSGRSLTVYDVKPSYQSQHGGKGGSPGTCVYRSVSARYLLTAYVAWVSRRVCDVNVQWL